MTREELACVAADAMDYRDRLSIAGDMSRAFLHLYAIHQASHWPCWPVDEDETPGEPFDANDENSPMGII